MRAGFTLIEMTITLAVVAVLMSAAVIGVGALTGAEARSAAGALAGAAQALFDQAALSGKTCRLVFELPSERAEKQNVVYRAECAEGAVTTARDRDLALRSANAAADEAQRRDPRILTGGGTGATPSLEELLSAERQRVEAAGAFSAYTNAVIEPRELPSSVDLEVWVRGQSGYTTEGLAMLYFFPQGYTEKAQVRFTQGDDSWTLVLEPLTGKVRVVPEALEVPR
ncbi:MAG TPA: prepilin-type N-terminal cleavage/methylation domain-containing protein [Myxococcaceae bacterium]|nr:prepilin-type N-terminal cleavage/methylation domain-containing protein [Myxococcaceae bacterium]